MGKLLLVALLAAACAGPQVRRARLTAAEPPSERELDAAVRVRARRCSGNWTLLVPGLGPYCHRKTGTGLLLMSLFAAETATAVIVGEQHGYEHPGALLPLVAAQDVFVYSLVDPVLDRQLARQARFVPQDSLAELAWAPFNREVLLRTDVWAGIAATLALGVGLSLAVDESLGDGGGDDANLFGRRFSPISGYPLGAATYGGLFSHVAIAEEVMFRGAAQSGLARHYGETNGWLGASLAFGLTHSLNALSLPAEDRAEYLLIGVPFITVVGSYLGLTYRWNDYSLTAPVAVHFWYDFLLSATFFAMDPEHSELSARVAVPF